MKNTIMNIAVAVIVLAVWFYPVTTTCVVIGAWNDVDPKCSQAVQIETMYANAGIGTVDSINAYYKVVDTQRQWIKAIKVMDVLGLQPKFDPKNDPKP